MARVTIKRNRMSASDIASIGWPVINASTSVAKAHLLRKTFGAPALFVHLGNGDFGLITPSSIFALVTNGPRTARQLPIATDAMTFPLFGFERQETIGNVLFQIESRFDTENRQILILHGRAPIAISDSKKLLELGGGAMAACTLDLLMCQHPKSFDLIA